MKSAESFDRDDLSGSNAGDSIADRIFAALRLTGVPQLHLRAAFPAGVRLRMEAPIGWVVVFALTISAHRERRHRGQRTIVRDVANDRETRSAIRAVDEWITVAPVGRIEHFATAIVTNCNVGRDENFLFLRAVALDNFELAITIRIEVANVEGDYAGERRRFGP